MHLSLNKLFFSSLLMMFISLNSNADAVPSKEREKNINDQIIEYILDGDVIKLSSNLEDSFYIVANEYIKSEYSVLLLHGRGLYPTEPNVMEPLRISFINQQINTYSLQLPVLDKGKSYYDYKKIFNYSDERVTSAINFMQSHRLIIIAHSCGTHMLTSWINNVGNMKNISGLILIGAGAVDKNQVMKDRIEYHNIDIPILNIYGENDHESVKNHSKIFNDMIKVKSQSKSKSIQINNSDHNYLDESNSLVNIVNSWLKSL